MAVETKYVCDHCGAESAEPRQGSLVIAYHRPPDGPIHEVYCCSPMCSTAMLDAIFTERATAVMPDTDALAYAN
jgi:hypothetical protein